MTTEASAPFTPFEAEKGLILATRLPGAAAEFENRRTWADLDAPREPPPLWIHLDRTKERAQRWIRAEAGLDPLVAESLLAEETRPRVQAVGDGLLVILRGVDLNPGAEPDELIAIRMWIEPTRVITLRQFRFQTIADLRVLAQRGAAPATAGSFLAAVATGLAARLGPSVDNLVELLDQIEDAMLERDTDDPADRSRLATIRRQAITLRRYLVPQRDAIMSLVTLPSPMLAVRDQTGLRVAAEQVARVAEALEEVRDRAAVTQDEMRARHEQRVGRTLYLLTLVATIALPLSLITGLLGINVGGIPLADSSLGFALVCVGLVLIAGVELALFKAMRWL
jgi:zinc transporter